MLLSGAEPVRSSSIFFAPHPQSAPAPPVAHAPIKQPIQSSPFNATDLAHIRRFRVELSHPDPDIRATARFQLMMFQERADQQAAWKERPAPLPVASLDVMANLF